MFGPGIFGLYLYAAQCLFQCGLSLPAFGLLVARPSTYYRPGPRETLPRTEIAGLWFCAETGPFIYWQFSIVANQVMFRTGCTDHSVVTRNPNCRKEMLPGTLFRTGCSDHSVVARNPNYCKEISPRTRFRTGCSDHSVVARNPKCYKEMSPRTWFRTGCSDHSVVARNPKCYKEMSPRTWFRTGCSDHSVVARKSTARNEMRHMIWFRLFRRRTLVLSQ